MTKKATEYLLTTQETKMLEKFRQLQSKVKATGTPHVLVVNVTPPGVVGYWHGSPGGTEKLTDV